MIERKPSACSQNYIIPRGARHSLYHSITLSFYHLLFLLCISPATAVVQPLSARAVRVIDGDTFTAVVRLESGAEVSVNVRIKNIDAPEIHGACEFENEWAVLSKNRLAELLPQGTEITLSGVKDDKYLKRIDARVVLNGKDVGDIMVKENMAVHYDGGKRKSWCAETKGETR